MVTSQIFDDFSFCLSCKQYDRDKRWCELFKRTMACGCQYGEDKKPRNHFEMVKAMSMDELATLINGAESEGRAYGPKGKVAWLKWLNAEVE